MTSTQSDYCHRALRPCFPRVGRTFCTVLLCGIVRLNAVPPVPSVTVVDIIPESLSGETSTNSEPNLAVNPANPSQIAASAYLPEPMGGRMSSILISTDGGTTWSCRSTVPIDKISCDVTLRFGGLNMLYVTALNDNFDFLICRSNQLASRRMDDSPLRQLQSGIDQPYIAAAVISVPLLFIAFREAGKLLNGFADPTKSSPASILWIFAIFAVLSLLWVSVFVISRRARPASDRLPFAAAAAIAMREAKKRPPAAKCAACSRARISDNVAKCLYCGAEFRGE